MTVTAGSWYFKFIFNYGEIHLTSWKRAWQPSPVFLPGESHGQRNLVGYGPWRRKESDTTELLNPHTHLTSKSSIFGVIYQA